MREGGMTEADDLQQARDLNRRLHRRVQEAEGPLLSQIARLRAEVEYLRRQESATFKRMCAAHTCLGECYKAAAKALGRRAAGYHSFMDHRQDGGEREDGKVYANAYLSKFGGIRTFDIVQSVREALSEHNPPKRTIRRWFAALREPDHG